jgi:hypothetical protein
MKPRRRLWAFLSLLLFAAWPAAAEENPVFLKAFYPLDEPRFHCVDIPGHKARVDTSRPLTVHTCKEGIWHRDQLFDAAALKDGRLRMAEYGLCGTADGAENGAVLMLRPCDGSTLQIWRRDDFRLTLAAHPDKCLTIGPEPSYLTPGGERLPTRHMARSLLLADCAPNDFQRQMWRFEAPQQRTEPILPFGK